MMKKRGTHLTSRFSVAPRRASKAAAAALTKPPFSMSFLTLEKEVGSRLTNLHVGKVSGGIL